MARIETSPEEAEQTPSAEQAFLEYFRGLEFAAPAYLAAGDFLRYEGLAEETTMLYRVLEEDYPEHRLVSESRLRSAELELALLNFQTTNRRLELKGYDQAYDKTSALFEKLETEIALNANAQYNGSNLAEVKLTIFTERQRVMNAVNQSIKAKAY